MMCAIGANCGMFTGVIMQPAGMRPSAADPMRHGVCTCASQRSDFPAAQVTGGDAAGTWSSGQEALSAVVVTQMGCARP